MILDHINNMNDIKKIPKEDYPKLAEEIRSFLVHSVSHTGGHLASNLGVVELTMALHIVSDLPKDKIIWDVGHQSYTHKILTGRKDLFDTLRTKDGISGFPKRKESPADCFETGHSSTSISAGLGIATARDLSGENYSVFSVIGDGSFTGGMVFEALNNAALLKTNFVIILNDNTMSISKNVGGINTMLSKIRTSVGYTNLRDNVSNSINQIPGVGKDIYKTISRTKQTIKQAFLKDGMVFEDMGITYLGPFDGHNTSQLIRVLNQAKRVNGAVIVHVLTQKGRGYKLAEKNPSHFHGVDPFNITTGKPLNRSSSPSYTQVFGEKILELGKKHEDITAITAAMSQGTGLSAFEEAFPNRFFDVGIAEQHAVTFAAGLAANGYKPFVAIYSSFLQRAYDQILHDVCIQNLPVTFCIDRAGLVGKDGETHQGIFDDSFLGGIPNLCLMAPKNDEELRLMLDFAYDYPHPVAIRYPRGTAYKGFAGQCKEIVYGKSEELKSGEEISVLFYGAMAETAEKTYQLLSEKGLSVSLINLRFSSPFDKEAVRKASASKVVAILEDNVYSGSLAERILAFSKEENLGGSFLPFTVPDQFIEHGKVEELKQMLHLDAESIAEKILNEYRRLS